MNINPQIIIEFKEFFALAVLVEPIIMTPAFLSSVKGLTVVEKMSHAVSIGFSVSIALIVSSLIGKPLLNVLGVSLPSMQIAGGIMMAILAIAMSLGREAIVKGEGKSGSVVPLAIPLLAGPASISYVISNNSQWLTINSAMDSLFPIVAVGIYCTVFYIFTVKSERIISEGAMDLIEKIGGMLLLAMSIELIATGIRNII
jgi:multiple antibiotic resistance protein